VSHSSFIKGNLIAACPIGEREYWMKSLSDASKVTFDNAMEGDKQVKYLIILNKLWAIYPIYTLTNLIENY